MRVGPAYHSAYGGIDAMASRPQQRDDRLDIGGLPGADEARDQRAARGMRLRSSVHLGWEFGR